MCVVAADGGREVMESLYGSAVINLGGTNHVKKKLKDILVNC